MPTTPNSVWNTNLAEALVGATILVGITYLNADGSPESQIQMYGVVESADQETGITLLLEGSRSGEIYRLPPDTRGFQEAPPGSYRLRSTNETVEDPDYTATWTVTRPKD